MVNRLHFRSPDAANAESKVYSASGTLEKLFKMKRAEFSGLEINLQLVIEPGAINSFVQLDLDSFRSALSNIINNSRDEIVKKGEPGTISVNLKKDHDFVVVSISDDGTAVPESKLLEINNGTCESTKHLGKPLGIASSREKLGKFDGTLAFSRIEPVGLKATIKLPSQTAPEWLATSINLLSAQKLVVFDDDESVHQTIRIRLLSDPGLSGVQLISCRTEKQLSDLVASGEAENALFLVDYEFRGNAKTGIDHDQFKLNNNSILMTSHWDEEKVLRECKLAKVRLLPKVLPIVSTLQPGRLPMWILFLWMITPLWVSLGELPQSPTG